MSSVFTGFYPPPSPLSLFQLCIRPSHSLTAEPGKSNLLPGNCVYLPRDFILKMLLSVTLTEFVILNPWLLYISVNGGLVKKHVPGYRLGLLNHCIFHSRHSDLHLKKACLLMGKAASPGWAESWEQQGAGVLVSGTEASQELWFCRLSRSRVMLFLFTHLFSGICGLLSVRSGHCL